MRYHLQYISYAINYCCNMQVTRNITRNIWNCVAFILFSARHYTNKSVRTRRASCVHDMFPIKLCVTILPRSRIDILAAMVTSREADYWGWLTVSPIFNLKESPCNCLWRKRLYPGRTGEFGRALGANRTIFRRADILTSCESVIPLEIYRKLGTRGLWSTGQEGGS